ncbi:tRNA preQ1(34) S-adenosylmethionine ribosyltransferase-isomerase QueA [Candidatus Kuenenbacteria bacterium CG11_big_fil_rev_8_21_14_0_20_37_9]|uniref:S-adenosylmethionine:tRNA ribosyltransferase-isomerase n=1 Tax=Candidatus Kuenenbacteria bacterium CG08_land_8_20_14_0_20_37_23 TaxID=1974617 RepID=A0A2M6XTG3_9BACT|nr:MAG: tRNA preQ1(34) S-adenosylmethionine ribosyltransferase-isomerase QueA [Candidatus Kuenenbacteria bacterium CG11_big_fil_rev_8_21_14_0_20_37_9]PIU10927.1 MAG: tRNA preQ1(34) S-adenosylmethionine ribosyltransferase-isomerase QueA [Candidatus Kuenenbacteria bacterium CG08_land_8_20_14_0_20_37_23]
MKLKLFNYYLPKNFIAQTPIKPRDKSRLLVVDKKTKKLTHDNFFNLNKYLTSNDVLIFNDSKVFPARLIMRKPTGGKIEVFLLHKIKNNCWEVLLNKKITAGNLQVMACDRQLKCKIIKHLSNGNWLAKFNYSGKKFDDIVDRIGETPLPPYIKTKDSKKIRQAYQTIFAAKKGSVAAPTAGLHFTKNLLAKLKKKGVKMEFITLHVGLGTFQPVKVQMIEQHRMYSELAELDPATAERLNAYKKQGQRIVAVGTTACRALEALANQKSRLKAGAKWVNIFIYPPYKFKFVDSLITNFHLPKSTLLMLVSALAGRKLILNIYRKAIRQKYRFYSFGDGMFIR